MPEIGEIRPGKEIGCSRSQVWQKFIWTVCEVCGEERWVASRQGKPLYKRCYSCTRKKGKLKKKSDSRGYIDVLLPPDDFFYSMANKHGYVAEHRLVMAQHLGRCLHPWEIVHHKGIRYSGIKNRSDNLMDNLQLISDMGHKQLSQLEAFICRLQRKNELLQIENSQLRKNINVHV